jgi:hypothetical protein
MRASHDDLKDSFYLRVIRTRLGAELREHYAVDEPMPDRLAELLKELDGEESEAPAGGAGAAPAEKGGR